MKRTKFSFILLLCLFVVPFSASAAFFSANEQISINQEIEEDLYAAGGVVTVSGSVEGDVFTAGGSVNVSGDVVEDLFAAGSSVVISGDVLDDVRVAGSSVVINGDIGDELFAAGSFIHVTSNVIGAAHLAGAAVVLDGGVGGDLFLASSSATLNGRVEGDITAYVEEMTLGDGVELEGTLTYYAPKELSFDEAYADNIVYGGPAVPDNGKNEAKDSFRGFISFIAFAKFFGILIAALIFGLMWPKVADTVSKQTVKNFWENLLTGLVVMIVMPVVVFLLCMSVVGWPLVAILMCITGILMILSTLYSTMFVGHLIMKYTKKQSTPKTSWYSIVLGVVALTLLCFIPVLGWIAVCMIYLATLGTLLQRLYQRAKELRA